MKKDSKGIASKVRPLYDRVLIKESLDHKETMTKSGIIIPVTVGEDKGSKGGTVVAVGPGRHENGKLIATSVKIGDSVLFQWGDKIKVDGEEYYLVRESEILAIIK
jgi:chaperonin GroES